MLRQLQLMREGVYRGYYLLSAIKRQGVPEVSSFRDRSSLASSLFNPAKRLCTVSARTTPASTAPEDTGRGREGEAKAKAKAELQEVLKKLGLPEASSMANVKEMICNVDRDSDGRVDFGEFKNMMQGITVWGA